MADIVPIRRGEQPAADVAVTPPGPEPYESDVHYELDLDLPPASPAPVPADLVPVAEDRLPVLPDALRSAENFRRAAVRVGGRHWHIARYHGLRSPVYLLAALWWAVVGIFRLGGRQVRWWWLLEQHGLRSLAAASGDSREWAKLHREGKETRRVRGMYLLAECAAILLGLLALVRFAPWWGWVLSGAVVLPLLARAGRPADKPIVSAAVVTARFRRLNPDIVIRAYQAAGLCNQDKPGQELAFGARMARDGDGTRVLVDLPYGRGLKDAVDAKDKLASGLDVTASQVFIHRDPTSQRRHTLWVADRDPLAVPVGRTPLLGGKPTDIWKACPVGLDERGQLVKVPLMWNSVLVSALPRAGKTFSARLLGLYAALDPYVKLSVFDFKGSPDWRKFALIADSCAFGLTPTRDGLPGDIFMNTLLDIKHDVQDRYTRLSELPADVCPEGKLTREIARNPRYRMPVRVLFLEEFQEVFDLGADEGSGKDASKQIASLLVYLVKVAPGAGVILVGSTQRPSGVGSGQVAQQFTSFRDNFSIRFGLRTSSWQVSELCLGAGAYSEGLDTSTLLPQYKGVGILRGASDASPTVRTYLADGRDAERILLAARALRERAGTLSGMAASEDMGPSVRDVLADIMAVFGGVAGLQWGDLAERLARQFPERYADVTADAMSAQCRNLGVPSVDVKAGGRALKGCRRSDIEAAMRVGAL